MVRPRVSVAMAVAAAVLAGSAAPSWAQKNAPPTVWSSYRNEAFHFTIDTPIPPKIEVTTSTSNVGPMPSLQGAMDLGERGALQITAVDVSQLKTAATPEAMLEGGVQGALDNAKLTKDYETTITKGAAIGREFAGHDATSQYRSRIYYLAGHFVAIAAGWTTGTEIPPDWARADSSLRFLP